MIRRAPPTGTESIGPARLGPLTIDVSSWVYGTVTLMSVLVVYDGWTELTRFVGVVIVVLGPTLALALAHLFADVIEFHVHESQPLELRDWKHAAADAGQFLLVAVPPLAVLFVTSLLRRSVSESIQSMLVVGVVSLGFWGWFAGRRAGLTGLRLLATALAGLLIGLVVIGFQIALKPH